MCVHQTTKFHRIRNTSSFTLCRARTSHSRWVQESDLSSTDIYCIIQLTCVLVFGNSLPNGEESESRIIETNPNVNEHSKKKSLIEFSIPDATPPRGSIDRINFSTLQSQRDDDHVQSRVKSSVSHTANEKKVRSSFI